MIADATTPPGLYVAYINVAGVTRWAGKKLLNWDGQNWFHPGSDQRYRSHVYGCIGPLPAMELEE